MSMNLPGVESHDVGAQPASAGEPYEEIRGMTAGIGAEPANPHRLAGDGAYVLATIQFDQE